MTEDKNQLQTLSRALDVLEMIESSASPMSLTEIARELDEVAPIVFRVLHTLEDRGYVRRRVEDKRYTHTSRSTGSGAIRRAIILLKSISVFAMRGVRIDELADHAMLDSAAVEELLRPLEASGVVEVSGDRWRASYGLMEIVRPLLVGDDVTHIVRPLMERLQVETGETVSLYRQAGSRQVVTAVIPSRHSLRYVLDVGASFPLHLGAAGKTALAALPVEDQDRLLSESESEYMTEYRTEPDRVRSELAEIRRCGYSLSTGERVEGASSVTTAIRDSAGNVRAVLGVMMPSLRVSTEQLHELGTLLVKETDALYMPPLADDDRHLLLTDPAT